MKRVRRLAKNLTQWLTGGMDMATPKNPPENGNHHNGHASLPSEKMPHPTLKLKSIESKVGAYGARGLSNKEIAKVLCMSERMVKHHMESVISKSGVEHRNRAAALCKLVSLGVIKLD